MSDEPVQIATRVSAALAADLQANADAHERSMSAELRLALRWWLDREQTAKQAAA